MPPWDVAAVNAVARSRPTEEQLQQLQEETAVYRRIIAEGGTLAMGTDSPLVPIGLQVHLGPRALHRFAGLTVAQTLRTATTAPARMFGVEDDLDTVEPGKLADLTVIDGDPFRDFADLPNVSWVMRDGIVHRRQDVIGSHRLAGAPGAGDSEHWHAVSQMMRREGCCAL
jgi:imidazolonepropionase-like amidohydrolase